MGVEGAEWRELVSLEKWIAIKYLGLESVAMNLR
jgi:hypothetical protein